MCLMLPYYRLFACLNMNFCVMNLTISHSLTSTSHSHTHTLTYTQARDQFAKSYSYSFRHMYGKEGSRKNYTPFSCMKIIMGSPPEAGAFHGCPFRSGIFISSLFFCTSHRHLHHPPNLSPSRKEKGQEILFQKM